MFALRTSKPDTHSVAGLFRRFGHSMSLDGDQLDDVIHNVCGPDHVRSLGQASGSVAFNRTGVGR